MPRDNDDTALEVILFELMPRNAGMRTVYRMEISDLMIDLARLVGLYQPLWWPGYVGCYPGGEFGVVTGSTLNRRDIRSACIVGSMLKGLDNLNDLIVSPQSHRKLTLDTFHTYVQQYVAALLEHPDSYVWVWHDS